MKKTRLLAFFILGLHLLSYSQSITLLPTSPVVKKNGLGFLHESNDGIQSIGTYVTNSEAFIQTNPNTYLKFATNEGAPDIILWPTGNLSIGSIATGTAKLEVIGFTKLGEQSSPIKMLELTGTTAATQGGSISIAHGLLFENILSISLSIDTGGGFVAENSKHAPGYEVGLSHETTLIYLWNKASNSSLVLSKPFKIIITYRDSTL